MLPRSELEQKVSRGWRGLSRRAKAGTAAIVVAILVLAAIGGCSGTNSGASNGPSAPTATPSGVTAAPPSANAATTPASATASIIATSPSPVASSVDVGDASAASAGASFVPTATGVLPPSSGGSSADRLPGEPNPSLTPGALNPAVTQATIDSTICVSGWTATIRPSESFTDALKVKQIVQYGYSDTRTSSYEEDHLISLELGGAPADARNLWPEPYTDSLPDGRSTGAYTKDAFETKLKTEVCAGSITLAQAQGEIGDHWVHAYYGIPLGVSPTNLPPTAVPTAAVTAPPKTAPPKTAPPATPIVTSPPVASLSVQITSLPASVSHGANATLVAVTSPGAKCSASVTYASGTVSTAAGLQTQPVAGSSGSVSWTWKVGSSTKPGTSTAEVTCTLGGASASSSQTFEVT
jgi:hypothetical protein